MTAKTLAAEALFPMLSVFHSIDGETLRAVWQVHTEGSLGRLVLDFGTNSLIVAADEDDDSIELSIRRALTRKKQVALTQASWSLGTPSLGCRSVGGG
jgi:hypothetical protein